MPYHPPGAHDPDYLMGLSLAENDYDDKEERWDGVDPDVDAEVDVDDMATQYLAGPRTPQAAAELAQGAVTAYMAKVARKNNVEQTFREHLDEVSPQRVAPAALEAFRTGYVIGLYQKVFAAVLERSVELLEERRADEVEDGRPPRQNPSGKEPLSYWESQGEWDAQQTFDLKELDDWVPLDNFLSDVFWPGRPEIDPARVHATARTVIADFLREIDEDGHEDEWVSAQQEDLDDMGHLPSEAYAAWKAGYAAVALPRVTAELERRARDR